MDNSRGARFSVLLGLEMKGAIVARGFTATAVADIIGVERATLNRYLNGKRIIPSPVVVLVAEAIHEDPALLVRRAWDRLNEEQPGTQVEKLALAAMSPS